MNTKKSKSKQLHISITEEDRAQIDSKAQRAGMNRSEYVRHTALNHQIEIPPVPTEVLNSLCNISTLLNKTGKLDPKSTTQIKKEVDSIWQLLNS